MNRVLEFTLIFFFSSTAYQSQPDTRYAGYAQTDYNSASQYGTTADYTTPAADYSQTAQYDSRSYGYGKQF